MSTTLEIKWSVSNVKYYHFIDMPRDTINNVLEDLVGDEICKGWQWLELDTTKKVSDFNADLVFHYFGY